MPRFFVLWNFTAPENPLFNEFRSTWRNLVEIYTELGKGSNREES